MSIPLVQNNEKDAINTSIIAIKRNIERINMLLGLVDNDSPDLSGFATGVLLVMLCALLIGLYKNYRREKNGE